MMAGDLSTSDSPLPAALYGSSHSSSLDQLDALGRPTAAANPWLKMYASDVQIAVDKGCLPEMPTSILEWRDVSAFQHCSFRQLKTFDSTISPAETESRHTPSSAAAQTHKCPACDRVFHTVGGQRTHMTMTHGDKQRRLMLTKRICVPGVDGYSATAML